MIITRKSPFSGAINSMDLDITPQQLADWESGGLIQVVMPYLTPSEREFLMTGITDAEWDSALGS